MSAALAHNAAASLVALYGDLLAEYERRVQGLTQQLAHEQLQRKLDAERHAAKLRELEVLHAGPTSASDK